MEIKLRLKRTPKVPIFAENLTPDGLKGKNPKEIGVLPLLEGSRSISLSDLFEVETGPADAEGKGDVNLTVTGDLSKFRSVGRGMSSGSVTIDGNGGFYVGAEMEGGSVTVKGNVGPWLGSLMKGGQIDVFGDADDYAGATLRGISKGMRGGTILIHGNTGNEVGRGMAEGLITIDGSVGLFAGTNMTNGAIVIRGDCAGRVGAGMKGGRIVVMGRIPELLPSYTFTELKDKVKFGKEKLSASFYVYSGDILEGGNGKIFVSRCGNRHLNPLAENFPNPALGLNKATMPYIEKMIRDAAQLNVEVVKHPSGATIIDAGMKAKGGYDAGLLVGLVCLGGMAELKIGRERYGDLELPTIYETVTAHPATVTLGSQFAGWAIKTDDFYALGSGPARAISLQPKKLYEKMCYKEKSEVAVVMIEADKMPTDSAIEYIAKESKVDRSNVYIVLASTSSEAGSVQIAARVVETGIHKLTEMGFNPNKILKGWGSAPIAPVHPKSEVAMGITNDMILYGGDVHYEAWCRSDDEIANILDEVPSVASRDYGRPFYEVYKAADCDFYKIDPGLFAPAKITVKNLKTGNTFTAGKINPEVLAKSLELLKIG